MKTLLLMTLFISNNWYEGGTLHKSNGHEWIRSTQENRLATSADLTANMLICMDIPFLVNSEEFKSTAIKLTNVIDNIYLIESERSILVSHISYTYFLSYYQ